MAAIVWFTGLSAAGKTTLCLEVAAALEGLGRPPMVLDGDVLRRTLSRDLGFSKEDRIENIRRIGDLALAEAGRGAIVLVAAISPYRQARDAVRLASAVPFLEVFVDAPLQICEDRDPKGLYRRARRGEITGFTGIDDPYEPPLTPEVHCITAEETVRESCRRVMAVLSPLVDPR